MKYPKTYCVLPFNQAFFPATGQLQLCCASDPNYPNKKNKRHISKFKNINEWFHSDYMNNVREAMLKGKPLKECVGCYKVEESGQQSLRQWENNEYFKNNPTRPLDEVKIDTMNIKFGNKCNLKCKMCFPYSSSEIWKEWKQLGWHNQNGPAKYFDSYIYEDFEWMANEENFKKLKDMAKHCTRLHFTGGEPMAMPRFHEFLKFCVENNYAKDISLEVITNGTKIHPRFFKYGEKFKEIEIHISIDGTNSTYDYIRYPGNYDVVLKNIKFYNEWLTNKTWGKLTFNFTLSVFNLHNVTEFIETISPLCVNNDKALQTFIMRDPDFMTFNMLPIEHIKKAIKELIQLENNTNNTVIKQTAWQFINEIMKPLPTGLSTIDKPHEALEPSLGLTNKESWEQLNDFVVKQDNLRKIHIKNYIPHLAEYFNY